MKRPDMKRYGCMLCISLVLAFFWLLSCLEGINLMFGFNFKSFLVDHHFLLMALLLCVLISVPTKTLSNKRNFPEHLHLEWRILALVQCQKSCCDYVIKKKNATSTATGADGTFETSSCWCRSTWTAVRSCWKSWWATNDPKLRAPKFSGLKGSKRSSWGFFRTSKKTLEYFKNWKENTIQTFPHSGWKTSVLGFYDVFCWSFFFPTAKATSFSWTPNWIWEHLISFRSNSTSIQEKIPLLNAPKADLSWV